MTKQALECKWRLLVREEDISPEDWNKIKKFLEDNNLKYQEYKVTFGWKLTGGIEEK